MFVVCNMYSIGDVRAGGQACAGGCDHVYCIGDVRAGGQACAGGGDHVYCIGDVHGMVDKHVLVAVRAGSNRSMFIIPKDYKY